MECVNHKNRIQEILVCEEGIFDVYGNELELVEQKAQTDKKGVETYLFRFAFKNNLIEIQPVKK